MQLTSDRSLVLKDGRTLGFAEYGDPLGIPILLFHGTPGSRLEGALFDHAAQAHHARILAAIVQATQPLQLCALAACWAMPKIVSP